MATCANVPTLEVVASGGAAARIVEQCISELCESKSSRTLQEPVVPWWSPSACLRPPPRDGTQLHTHFGDRLHRQHLA